MGPGSGPSVDRVFLKNGGTRTVKQFRHVLVPPAFAQMHAMRMHLAVEHYPPPLYEKGTHEDERMGTVFRVSMRDQRTTSHGVVVNTPRWATSTTTCRKRCTPTIFRHCHLARSRHHRSLTVLC